MKLDWLVSETRYPPISVSPDLGLPVYTSTPDINDYNGSLVLDYSRKLRVL